MAPVQPAAYVEKNDFEDHLAFGGGFVVVPTEKH
jgi:hypothetical protein